MCIEAFVGWVDQGQRPLLAVVRLEGHGRAHAHDVGRHRLGIDHPRAIHFRQEFLRDVGLTLQRSGGEVGQPFVIGIADDDLGN